MRYGRLVLSLAVVAAGAACRTRLPDGSSTGRDLATAAGWADMGDTTAQFIGIFTWDGTVSTSQMDCDNGGGGKDPPPGGDFTVTVGPGANQINIGAGTNGCPIFIFDLAGESATLTDTGVTCASGPGMLTTRSGTLSTTDGGNTLLVSLVLDQEVPDGGGGMVHCTLSVGGVARRKQ